MKAIAALLFVFVSGTAAIHAQAQEPRLPAPTETPSENEALIRRARGLHASRNFQIRNVYRVLHVQFRNIDVYRLGRVRRFAKNLDLTQ